MLNIFYISIQNGFKNQPEISTINLLIFIFSLKISKNYFTMLDIKTTATISHIKKAYEKLALL